MPFNSVFSWFMKKRVHQIELFKKYPVEVQRDVFQILLERGMETDFGRRHGFSGIVSFEDFKSAVPVRTYEEFEPMIQRMRNGEEDVLWPGKIKWFAKSSGTTSGRSKYLPVSKEALEDCHYKGGKDFLSLYYHNNPLAQVYGGKTLVMGGSSKLDEFDEESYTGDLSAIIIQNLPIWVELRRTPNRDIALMDNWEEKIERMAEKTMNEDVRMIVGVPSWTLVLIKHILEKTGKKYISEVWPNLELFMHGGVSFAPYKKTFNELTEGLEMNFLETYNASEGFFGIQDRLHRNDMLLMLDYGILYEFMPLSELGKRFPVTYSLEDVEIGVSYALVISTNSGLWRYLIGDTIRFTSTYPFRVQVTGRTKHFMNAFGEELIIENADFAIQKAANACGVNVVDYTAAPIFMNGKDKGGHEWLVEFENGTPELSAFQGFLDQALREVNSDYDAKRSHDLALGSPSVRIIPKGSFHRWLKSKGQLGGQHKVPRLLNDRTVIDNILKDITVLESC